MEWRNSQGAGASRWDAGSGHLSLAGYEPTPWCILLATILLAGTSNPFHPVKVQKGYTMNSDLLPGHLLINLMQGLPRALLIRLHFRYFYHSQTAAHLR